MIGGADFVPRSSEVQWWLLIEAVSEPLERIPSLR